MTCLSHDVQSSGCRYQANTTDGLLTPMACESFDFLVVKPQRHVVSGISKAMRHDKTLRKLSMRKCSGVDQTAVSAFCGDCREQQLSTGLHVKQDIDGEWCMLLLQALCDNTVLTTLALPTELQNYVITSSSCEVK